MLTTNLVVVYEVYSADIALLVLGETSPWEYVAILRMCLDAQDEHEAAQNRRERQD